MKKLFLAIRRGDLGVVKELLDRTPNLIACTAKQPPKKDDGQSPLQVAIKTGNFEIANLLLDLGADVCFMEAENSCNEWRAPVIHDAITAAVMCSRWNMAVEDAQGNLKADVKNSKEEAGEAFDILKRVIDMGADANAVDSFGNSCVWRLCLDARQILPRYNCGEKRMERDRMLTPELEKDLERIFKLLYDNGMDDAHIGPGEIAATAGEFFKDEPVAQFLKAKR